MKTTKVKSLTFMTPVDIYNDSADVFVKLEDDDSTY